MQLLGKDVGRLLAFLTFFLFSVYVEAQVGSTFVHLFGWTWKQVEKECREFLGPMGYAAVQVSPPNEHAVLPDNPWYQRYQPVSYQIESHSGSRDDFYSMVHTCAQHGVKIYADVVINHMTGTQSENKKQVGSAGSKYGHYSYPGLFEQDDFHFCGRYGDNDIRNYYDRWEVQNCELVNLADLKTESHHVRTRITSYLNDLISLGVAGFRIDAAKHIPAVDIRSFLSEVYGSPFVFQEVIDQGREPISAWEYLGLGYVTEFRYSLDLSRVFRTGKLAWLNEKHQFGEGWSYLPATGAVVFVDNHDNQRGHGGGGDVLTHREGALYELANALMLAWPYGYPKVMSSFAFVRDEQGPPLASGCLNKDLSQTAREGWVCEHRWPKIANMVRFRSATQSYPFISNWWTDGENQIAFSRGALGFFALNLGDRVLQKTFKTNLPDGEYCNLGVNELVIRESCTTNKVSVTSGFLNVSLFPGEYLAIHVN